MEDAWDDSKNSAVALRFQLRKREREAAALIEGGSMSSASHNGRNSQFSPEGPGNITTMEVAQLYRELIDEFGETFKFLSSCASVGIDPFMAEFQQFPNNAVVVNPALLIDSTLRFAQLCTEFNIDSTQVVGKPIGDPAVFCWMMFHEFAVIEQRNDYTLMRVSEGNQFT